MGDKILRLLVIVLIFPLIGGGLAYLRGLRSRAFQLNGIFLLLMLGGSLSAMLMNPSVNITTGGWAYLACLLILLTACFLPFYFQKFPGVLFWTVWILELGIFSFLFYLSFLFKIF